MQTRSDSQVTAASPEADPVLALLDFLHAYRRSWRCWIIGGPAAVDELAVGAVGHAAGTRVRVAHDLFADLPDSPAGVPLWTGARTHDILPPEAKGTDAVPLLRRALGTPGQHAAVALGSISDVTGIVSELQPVREAVYRHIERLMVPPRPEPGYRGKPTPRRPEVLVAWASIVGLRLGRRRWQFWHAGIGDSGQGALVGADARQSGRALLRDLPVTVLMQALAGVPLAGVFLLFGHHLSDIWRAILIGMFCGPTSAYALRILVCAWRKMRSCTQDGAEWWRHVRHSQGKEADPLVVVTGPDAGASALIYSLFLHLAGLAGLAEGGVVLNDAYEDLLPLLVPGAQVPGGSATHRVRFGDAAGMPPSVRFVHLLSRPEDGWCPLALRLLGRAARLWVVLPRGTDAAEAARIVKGLRGEAREASLLVVRDGADGAALPGLGAADRVVDVDLSGLGDRYLAGGVLPPEAAAWVRRLADDDPRSASPPGPSTAEAQRTAESAERSWDPRSHTKVHEGS